MAAGRRKSGPLLIVLALLLIVGLGAIFILFRNQILPSSAPAAAAPAAQPQEEMVNIVITTQAIPRGTKITDAVVTTVPYPKKDLVQSTFFQNVSDVLGKQARYDLEARLPLTSSLLADAKVGSVAAFEIPKGMVAISIPISRLTAVSYAPQPGDHVNVLVSLLLTDVDPTFQTRLPNNTGVVTKPGQQVENGPTTLTIGVAGSDAAQGRVEMDGTLGQAIYVMPSEDTQRPRPVSQTLIQDAIVLHVGSFLEKDGQEATDPNAQATPSADPRTGQVPTPAAPKEPEDITLVVSPQDAVTINYLLLTDAKMNLVLRSAGDTEKPKTEAVTLQFLMDQYNLPNPAKLPYAQEPRVDNLEYPDLPTATPVPQQ